MLNKNKNNHESHLSFSNAVEMLSELASSTVSEIPPEETKIAKRSIRWLKTTGGNISPLDARHSIEAVLDYIKQFYAMHHGIIQDKPSMRKMRSIMLLVGDAAKKWDVYSQLFANKRHKRMEEMSEYRELQNFYIKKVEPKIEEALLGRWLLGLAAREEGQEETPSPAKTKHQIVGLDSVLKDTEYELFLIRKEDGTRFFSPRLLKNLKLANDCGSCFSEEKSEEPSFDSAKWSDAFTQRSAKDMVSHLKQQLDLFFKETLKNHRGKELVIEMNKAVMALLLSASPLHLKTNGMTKGCSAYFHDFRFFLRQVIASNEFQKLIIHPPKENQRLMSSLYRTVIEICRALYLYGHGWQALRPLITEIMDHQIAQKDKSITQKLKSDYLNLQEKLKGHAHGPLNRVLEAIFESRNAIFDPLAELNLPTQVCAIYVGEHRAIQTRMASPTIQEYIHKSCINPEFKGFLLSCEENHTIKKHLCILLQDRTSWSGIARCHAMEMMDQHREFGKHLDVATLAFNTDFYWQNPPYQQEHRTELFKEQFLEHLSDQQSGFRFPVYMRAELFKSFFRRVLDAIHDLFFMNRAILTKEERAAFIDLCYTFTIWKLIELSDAQNFSLTCKDGVDTGPALGGSLFMLCNFLWSHKQHPDLENYLRLQLFTPALLWRERVILPEQFNRLSKVLEIMENRHREMGHGNFIAKAKALFAHLYQWPWFEGEIQWPSAGD